MEQLPLLTLLTFSPLIGVVILLFIHRDNVTRLKTVGMIAPIVPLVLALVLYIQFQPGLGETQFVQTVDWFKIQFGQGYEFAVTYSMGVDGLSMPLIVLTALVTALAAIASMYVKRNVKSYFILFLLLELGMLGVFAARDLFLFFLFFEVTLVTTFLLIGGWGYVNRERAANQFLLYNGLGSGIMLLAFIAVWIMFGTMQYDGISERVSELAAYVKSAPVVDWFMPATFWAIVIAFGIKLPFFPFHTWMLRVHVEAPPAVVMLHSGILLKMGAYGLIRFGVGFFPSYVEQFAWFIGLLGVVSLLYGGFLAIVQTELKRLIAYSSVSHMGIVLVGIAALNVTGLQGAVFQAVSHGFISALLFFFIAVLSERTGTTRLAELGGLAKQAPILSGLFLAAGMATLGLPGMSGFISEFLAFLGIFRTYPILGVFGIIGIVLAAVYMLRAVLTTTFGQAKEKWEHISDTRAVEAVPMFVLLACIILIGVYPAVLSEPLQLTLETIVSRIGG